LKGGLARTTAPGLARRYEHDTPPHTRQRRRLQQGVRLLGRLRVSACAAVRGGRYGRLRVAGCGLRVAGCGLRVAGCGLRAAGCGLRAAGCGRSAAAVGVCAASAASRAWPRSASVRASIAGSGTSAATSRVRSCARSVLDSNADRLTTHVAKCSRQAGVRHSSALRAALLKTDTGAKLKGLDQARAVERSEPMKPRTNTERRSPTRAPS
jgi:hypothetical protein